MPAVFLEAPVLGQYRGRVEKPTMNHLGVWFQNPAISVYDTISRKSQI